MGPAGDRSPEWPSEPEPLLAANGRDHGQGQVGERMGPPVKTALVLLASLLVLTPACGPKGDAKSADAPAAAEAGTFRFAPRLGSKFRHVMSRTQELSIVGTPLRQIEEWKLTWDVELSAEQDAVLMRATMVTLELALNGAAVLRGDEVTPKQ